MSRFPVVSFRWNLPLVGEIIVIVSGCFFFPVFLLNHMASILTA